MSFERTDAKNRAANIIIFLMMQEGKGIFFQLGVRSYKLGVGSCSVVALRQCEARSSPG